MTVAGQSTCHHGVRCRSSMSGGDHRGGPLRLPAGSRQGCAGVLSRSEVNGMPGRSSSVQQVGHRASADRRRSRPARSRARGSGRRSSLVRSRRGGGDRAGDHVDGAPEVVLVVGVAGGAVGDDQCGLARPAGPPGALGVVGRASEGRCAGRRRSGSAMSTPSSIVGEQYSSGRSPLRKASSRSSRSAAGTWAVCSRACMPASSGAMSR